MFHRVLFDQAGEREEREEWVLLGIFIESKNILSRKRLIRVRIAGVVRDFKRSLSPMEGLVC